MSYGARKSGSSQSGGNSTKGQNKNVTQPEFDKSSNPTAKTTRFKEGDVKKTPAPIQRNKNEFGY